MQNLLIKKPLKESSQLPSNSPYYVSSSNLSDPSILSSTSSQRYSEMTSSSSVDPPISTEDLDHFDIIDSLDFDDVDDALIDQELTHQQREAIVQNLYESEKEYLNTLSLVVNSYILPLRKNIKQPSFNFLGLKKMPCTEREMRWLFGNFEDIHKLHVDNLAGLDDRLSIWGPTQIISDVIQAWFSRLQQQYMAYFDNYDILVTTYERLKRYQPFKKFTESIDKSVNLRDASLLSLLQTPVHCIQRYQKILKALADNTSSMHPDYTGLMQCRNKIQTMAEEFRLRFDDAKNVDRVYNILTSMANQPFSVKAERRLYLQNSFNRLTRTTGEDIVYFLFSDILVYAKQKQSHLNYKGHIVLNRAKVRATPAEESNTTESFPIEITSPFQGVDSLNTTFMGTPTTHIIHTSSKDEQTKWIVCIETVVAKLDQAHQSKISLSNSKNLSSSAGSLRRHGTTSSSNGSSNQSSTQ